MDEGSRSSAAYQALAVATQAVSKQLLTPEMKQFLAGLQPLQRFQLDSAVCVACHAVPSDPLYFYLPEISPVTLWESELNTVNYPDFLFLGHTHVPMKTRFRRTLVVNPGSVGQPKDGDPARLMRSGTTGRSPFGGPPMTWRKRLRPMAACGFEPHIVDTLAEVLRTGGHLPLDQNAGRAFQRLLPKAP